MGNGKKEEEDLQNLLESVDIYKFEKYKKSVEAKLVLQIVLQKLIAASKFPEIFCSVRTFIMAMIYLKNANRPGPLSLMTAADYNWRTKIEEDKEFI